jgi:hypothetical protein
MNLLKHIALVSAVALAPALALAQTTPPAPSNPPAAGQPGAGQPGATKGGHRHHRGGGRLMAADKDGDGAISKAEADGAGMKRLSANFDKIDANKDGKITREEMRAYRVAHRGEHKGRRGAGPGGPGAPATPATPATPPAAK